MDAAVRNAVATVMESYFEGLHSADPATLRQVFHKDLGYVNAVPGAYVAKNLEDYLADVATRSPSPPDHEPQIEHVTQVSENVALVVATMSLMNRDYRDALTLVRTEGQWRVISKVFEFTEQGEG